MTFAEEFYQEVRRVLPGLPPPNLVTKFTLELRPGEPPTLTLVCYADDDTRGRLCTILSRYRLEKQENS